MTVPCQRWRLGRDTYRPAGEVVDTRTLEVGEILSDNVARTFVVAHHYSASYPAARYRYGLYQAAKLVGVAVFSYPSNALALAPLPAPSLSAPGEAKKRDPRVELGRFVLLDEVGANAETWFLARCFEALRRKDVIGVVSFSDPYPRTTADGRVVFGGHIGTVYQAGNAVYLGQARPDTARLLPDGRSLHNRSIAKLRAQDRGWRYVVDELVKYGATPPRGDEDLASWTDVWVAALTRKVRRPGNLKYVWALDRRLRRHLPVSLPYPKKLHLEAA